MGETAEDAFAHERRRMVELALAPRRISAPTLEAFASVPRECFVPEELHLRAYEDGPLPIGGHQTISQPYIVARTVDALELRREDRVLEVGTGSGYAAAILARLAREVHTVERIGWLARQARDRLERLGFSNVAVHQADGSLGWPAAAPYDAIAVAAGGPLVPQELLDQLAVGGRLVMPVTAKTGIGQTLVRIRRTGTCDYEEEELEQVHFVPLIGARAHAHSGDDPDAVVQHVAVAGKIPAAARLVREVAEPIADVDGGRIDALVERLSSARIVLLGESTHGTSEFYRLRARITRRLLERYDFDVVAVEADWPDAESFDAHVRRVPLVSPRFPWRPFERFPAWMWRNAEVRAFVDWLRRHNQDAAERRRAVGFHGLDLYSMYSSIGFVVSYLERVDPAAAGRARKRYARLRPFEASPEGYGMAALGGRTEVAEKHVLATLREMLAKRLEYTRGDGERFLDAAQNARVVAAAERYYREMFFGVAQSWNLRDTHMFDTLRHLLAHYGPRPKAIVWAHNAHVGDARATEMARSRELNLGQLCRQAFGDEVRIVGFGTHRGTVVAARAWDEPGEEMTVRPGHPESYEHMLHDAGVPVFALSFRDGPRVSAVREELAASRLLRSIGVVYTPESELESHYVVTTLPAAYDEMVWIDETTGVEPLPAGPPPPRGDLPETYPFAL